MAGVESGAVNDQTIQALQALAASRLNGHAANGAAAFDRPHEASAPALEVVAPAPPASPQSGSTASSSHARSGPRPSAPDLTATLTSPPPLPRDEPATEPDTLSRSDRIAMMSIVLAFLFLALRYRYPDYAREVGVEFRYMLGLVASCFMLGISGWFDVGKRRVTKPEAVLTIVCLVALMGLWEILLSGSLSSIARTLSAAIAARLS